MNKSELIKSAASRSGLSVKETSAGVAALLEVLTEALQAGEPVRLRGFGSFTLRERKAHMGYDLAAGKTTVIPAARGVKFTYSKPLSIDLKT